MDYDKFDKVLKKLLTEKRYEHVKRVRLKALELAALYNAPIEQVETAAFLHDIAKYFDDDVAYSMIEDEYKEFVSGEFKINQILHGFAGAAYIKKEFGIDDEEILNAIRFHTIGRANMSLVEKIVYLADAIEDGRDYPNVDKMREMAKDNLDKTILFEINQKIVHLVQKNSLIHPNALKLRNSLILENGE